MTEADLQRQVERLLDDLGCLHVHLPRSKRSKTHWPDLVVCTADGRTLYRELKLTSGVIAWGQQRTIERLRATGHDAGYWTEEDLQAGAIAAEILDGQPAPVRVVRPASIRAGMLLGREERDRRIMELMTEHGLQRMAAERVVAAEVEGGE